MVSARVDSAAAAATRTVRGDRRAPPQVPPAVRVVRLPFRARARQDDARRHWRAGDGRAREGHRREGHVYRRGRRRRASKYRRFCGDRRGRRSRSHRAAGGRRQRHGDADGRGGSAARARRVVRARRKWRIHRTFAELPKTGRGDAAAGTWIFLSRRRRGAAAAGDADSPSRRVAARPGHSRRRRPSTRLRHRELHLPMHPQVPIGQAYSEWYVHENRDQHAVDVARVSTFWPSTPKPEGWPDWHPMALTGPRDVFAYAARRRNLGSRRRRSPSWLTFAALACGVFVPRWQHPCLLVCGVGTRQHPRLLVCGVGLCGWCPL